MAGTAALCVTRCLLYGGRSSARAACGWPNVPGTSLRNGCSADWAGGVGTAAIRLAF